MDTKKRIKLLQEQRELKKQTKLYSGVLNIINIDGKALPDSAFLH